MRKKTYVLFLKIVTVLTLNLLLAVKFATCMKLMKSPFFLLLLIVSVPLMLS